MQTPAFGVKATMDNTREENITAFVEQIKHFREEDVECHFNWNLEKFDTKFDVRERFASRLRDKDLIIQTPLVQKWALQLNHGYEVFKVDKKSGEDIVKEAVDEMESTDDTLFVEYKVAFRHVACSLLATMLLESYPASQVTDRLHDLLLKVIKLNNMSNSQKSGVLGLKALVLHGYGSDGTEAAIPVITEATRLCPQEYEWKLSQVIILTRMRHFNRGLSVTQEDVALPMKILEELLASEDVYGDKAVTCKYFLAVTHKDLILMPRGDSELNQIEKSKDELKRLTLEIFRSETDSPQIVSFVAHELALYGQLTLGISMIKSALERFPRHIGLNTMISKLYKLSREYDKLLHHSKIAMDEGGYGAAWIYLGNATKSKIHMDFEEFFRTLVNQQSYSYKAQTHVSAALFYYFWRSDPLGGSYHIKSALEADPTYRGLTDEFCGWVKSRVNPLEVAYNQIHFHLRRAALSLRDMRILKEVQEMISNHTDVTSFVTSRDLVNEFKEKQRQYYRNRSMSSAESARPGSERSFCGEEESSGKSWRRASGQNNNAD